MITPDHFRVNEAWIAIKINEEFLYIESEPYDVYLLMDAASCYVFGHVFSCVADEVPDERDVQALFQQAWGAKRQWAEILILTGNSPADDAFSKQAVQNGLSTKKIPLSDLEPIIGPLKESFASNLAGEA